MRTRIQSRAGLLARAAVAMALLGMAIQLNLSLERTATRRPTRHSLYIPSGEYLRFASLGHRSLLADILYIWSIQYYSDELRTERWRYLGRLYDAITDLDPRFLVAYSVGALILSLEAHDSRAALALLNKGIERNPGTYLLAWEAAFYARDMRELKLMHDYLATAKGRPDAPPYVARWYLNTLDQLGERQSALALWREVAATAPTEYERQVARRWVHDLTLEEQLQALSDRIRSFTTSTGRPPRSLAELVPGGEVVDTEGHPITYDPASGTVRQSCGFLLRHRLKR